MRFSLGLVEVSALGNAIAMLDEMVKAANVEFVAVERKLGGRLVTIVVKGSVSDVTAAVEAGSRFAKLNDCLKAAEVIANPHPEILKFVHLDEEDVVAPDSESAATHTGSVGKAKPEEKTSGDKKKTAKAPAKSTKSQAQKASDTKTKARKGTTKK